MVIRNFPVLRRYQLNDEGGFRRVPSRHTSLRGLSRIGWIKLQSANPQRIGPYRLIRELGSGGLGRVFLGRSAGGRPVAVKVIRTDLGADPEFRERFRREVAAAQKVNGLYTGPSLAEAVSRHGPLPVTAVRVLAAGLAEGRVRAAIPEPGRRAGRSAGLSQHDPRPEQDRQFPGSTHHYCWRRRFRLVWNRPPSVLALAAQQAAGAGGGRWRPDGRYLAIGNTAGEVYQVIRDE